MQKSGFSKSRRKFIRLEKARIRSQFFDVKKQEEMINNLYALVVQKPGAGVSAEAKKEAKKLVVVTKKPAASKKVVAEK